MTTDKPVLRVGLLICSDLFFTSKVTGTAQALGLRVDAVDDIVSARLRLEAGGIGCVLLDLAAPRVSIVELVAAMPESARVPIIAFGSHVNVELLESARAAGAEVMPRSQFSATLPNILTQHLPR
ncbi:MAG: response regulator [Planctomycetes bacterium]|nr:response regulator [Planctomycetota bacterium]